MISIICAFNNIEVLNNMLIKSLKMQTYSNYELIIINAKEKGFKSAFETLNYGAEISNGDILIFAHQDIEFLDETALQKIEFFSNNNEFGVAGVAGEIGEKKFKVYSSVVMGNAHKQAGIKNNKIIEAYSLDECLLIVKRDNFLKFNNLGDTWHFYGPDISIKSIENNQKVLLFPIEIYHLSEANSLNYNYFDTLLKFAKIHKNEKIIRTCCGNFKNNFFIRAYCFYRKFKLFIKKRFKGVE